MTQNAHFRNYIATRLHEVREALFESRGTKTDELFGELETYNSVTDVEFSPEQILFELENVRRTWFREEAKRSSSPIIRKLAGASTGDRYNPFRSSRLKGRLNAFRKICQRFELVST